MQKEQEKGVCLINRIPPNMTVAKLRELLDIYKVERIYLERRQDGKGYSKGWIEFEQKKLAKLVAQSLNGSKMVGKKGNRNSDDYWQLKYLSGFKWEHLHDPSKRQENKEKIRFELEQAKKVHDFYQELQEKSRKKIKKNDD